MLESLGIAYAVLTGSIVALAYGGRIVAGALANRKACKARK